MRRNLLRTVLDWSRKPAPTPVGSLPPRQVPRAEPGQIWIDVGAHLGEKTFASAEANPSLRVYAFEPVLRLAAQRLGRLPNFVVVPMAVAEHDGCADFYLNEFPAASSLLPFDPDGLAGWRGGDVLKIERKLTVPTIRLDTFLNVMAIPKVQFLKIDAQGADLAVIRSLGKRLKDVDKISLEVQINPVPLYAGGTRVDEVERYMRAAGFTLDAREKQSFDQEENLTYVRAA
jgi:FkbM family methyltransferase